MRQFIFEATRQLQRGSEIGAGNRPKSNMCGEALRGSLSLKKTAEVPAIFFSIMCPPIEKQESS